MPASLITRAALVALLAVSACKPESAPPAAAATAKTYAMRGVLQAIPASSTSRSLSIKHEAVDDFVGDSGAVVGMDSMVMPFQLAPGLDVSGLHVGDKLAFTIAVDWAVPRVQITAMTVLPAETALEFGKARPPAQR